MYLCVCVCGGGGVIHILYEAVYLAKVWVNSLYWVFNVGWYVDLDLILMLDFSSQIGL